MKLLSQKEEQYVTSRYNLITNLFFFIFFFLFLQENATKETTTAYLTQVYT